LTFTFEALDECARLRLFFLNIFVTDLTYDNTAKGGQITIEEAEEAEEKAITPNKCKEGSR